MIASEPKYPIGIQTFQELRENGFVYVDKTEPIYRLITSGKYFFLSRPRRFGKSLLLSTIEAFFQGKRNLFEGLFISGVAEEWNSYPVLHLNLNSGDFSSETALLETLDLQFRDWEETYGSNPAETYPSSRMGGIIKRAFEKTGKQVVVLVDECDKPILQTLHRKDLCDKFRDILKSVYSNLKTCDRYIRFALVTGVARFGKVSIFSDLNNLRDISFDDAFSTICGITEEELEDYFQQGISQLSKAEEMSEQEVMCELRERYDGYHFSEKSQGVYNPFSLLNVFASGRFGNFWFATGTPTFLARMLSSGKWRLSDLQGYESDGDTLSSIDIGLQDPVPILFQTGYLTIAGYDRRFRLYRLDYPNREVKEGFLKFLLPYFADTTKSQSEFDISCFVRDVIAGNVDDFMHRLESLTASVPYDGIGKPVERYFNNLLYLVFTLMGFYTATELHTSDGSIDLVVDTGMCRYLFEFKVDSTPEAAMDPLLRKEYAKAFAMEGKPIYLIGANFSTTTRRIDGWLCQPLQR